MMKYLPALLSFNGGYVDTAGFLALQGLFTAHVTGNFVTAAAALVLGTSGIVAKLLALPVFCVVVALIRVLGHALAGRGALRGRVLLGVKFLLLCAGFALAVHFGPFPDGDSGPAMLTGMVLVAAMAVQNATQRVHLPAHPPSTLMTGNTTQAVLDTVDLLGGYPVDAALLRTRLGRLLTAIGSFALGCAAAALFTAIAGVWCFALPPVIAVVIIVIWRETIA